MARVHVIGAGLAGLGTAVRLAEQGVSVSLYDQSPQAGGRARSYMDKRLGCEIDNGNHLMMAGNWAAMWLMDTIGAQDERIGPDEAVFPFLDLESGKRWTIKFNDGLLPKWVFNPSSRVPDTSLMHYLPLGLMAYAGNGDTVAHYIPSHHPLYRNLVEPLCVAVLNVEPERASAKLMAAVLRETVLRGAGPSRPIISKNGLSKTFAEPALRYLEARGAAVHLGRRINGFVEQNGEVAALKSGDDTIQLGPQDLVVLAIPGDGACGFIPDLETPDGMTPIVNVHYRLNGPVHVNWPTPFLGLVGGVAQWLFVRDDIASVTISAAEKLVDEDSDAIAQMVWRDVAQALQMQSAPMPNVRVVKEKRATFLQSPENLGKRPSTETRLANVFLAGDWTDTGLPATIEGSVRSGYKAAEVCVAVLGQKPRPTMKMILNKKLKGSKR